MSTPATAAAVILKPAADKLHPYAARVLSELRARVPWEGQFLDAVEDVFASLTLVLEQHPVYQAEGILERMVEPERAIAFRVPWTDDRQRVRVERGWRVQFNSALGPCKGGTRFHSSVNLDTLKSLGFEQIFKNALTGLSLGGAKGGADVDFRGRSEREMMRFCQSYMTELARHIGPRIDVPAGDIGVGTREIGYLYGQYKRLTRSFDGAITGKALQWGGSPLRPEATGYGVAYFVEEMLASASESLAGKTVAVSGFGNVAWGVVKKVTQLGGRVVTLSGPDGFIHDPDGISEEGADYMLEMRLRGLDRVRDYADRFGVVFHVGSRPWVVPCDVALPCAIQRELDADDARALVEGGCRYVIEGANMPVTSTAVQILRDAGVIFAPGKAANAGGVAVSGLEMAQNSELQVWSRERVELALREIMSNIHRLCLTSAERVGRPGDYLVGANVGGFLRVADAMLDQGLV